MRPHVGLVPPLPIAHRAPERSPSAATIVASALLLAVAAGLSLATFQQLERFVLDLDRAALGHAEQAFGAAVEQQRGNLRAQIGVLADDTRVRATVMIPKFDENTVRDVLDDLKKASGASVLAIIDSGGKVKAVAGLDRLRGADVGSSPVVKSAIEGPAVDLWTFAEQVLVVGVAPIRSGDQVPALLLMGYALGDRLLNEIQLTSGVFGAAFVGDRMVLVGTQDPRIRQAFLQAASISEATDAVVGAGGDFRARIRPTSQAAAAARLVWLVPRHGAGDQVRLLGVLAWVPAGAVLLTLLVFRSLGRKRRQGDDS